MVEIGGKMMFGVDVLGELSDDLAIDVFEAIALLTLKMAVAGLRAWWCILITDGASSVKNFFHKSFVEAFVDNAINGRKSDFRVDSLG